MQIAVLSDTHLTQISSAFVSVCKRYLQTADAVIHCGDMVGEEIEAYLQTMPNFRAVKGNCDFRLHIPASLTLQIEGLQIGIAHGWGRTNVGETVARAFGTGYDLILYGHTHKRDWSKAGTGAYLLNPGSLTEPRDDKAGLAILRLKKNLPPSAEFIDFTEI